MVDGRNNEYLAIPESKGFDTWYGNARTRAGDLVLIYRTIAYCDISCVFLAIGDPRPTNPSQEWPWKVAVDLGNGLRLRRVIKLDGLKQGGGVRGWSLLKN